MIHRGTLNQEQQLQLAAMLTAKIEARTSEGQLSELVPLCEAAITAGNRDFLLGDAFCRAASATLLTDPSIISTPIGPALLMHGDSLCTRDTEYMNARKLLRSSAFQADFLSKSLSKRDAFARQLRGESTAHTRETAADIMDVTQSEVEHALQTADVSIMIHGHTHRPAVHELTLSTGTAVRFVLGDWHESMQYLAISDSGADLLTFTL